MFCFCSGMYPFRPDPIIRLRIGPPGGEAPRPHPQHAHPDSVVAAARQLVEGTTLPHKVIGARVGVDKGTISRWIEKHGWVRPPGASKSSRRPGARYVPVLVGRALSQRLRIQAERLVAEIEAAPQVDADKLAQALDLVAKARAEQHVRRGRRTMPPPPGSIPPPEPKPRKTWDRSEAAARGWTKRYGRSRRWGLPQE
jgi:hypothetical protein